MFSWLVWFSLVQYKILLTLFFNNGNTKGSIPTHLYICLWPWPSTPDPQINRVPLLSPRISIFAYDLDLRPLTPKSIDFISSSCLTCLPSLMKIQWWFVNPSSDSPEISLVRTKSVGTDFHVQTNGRFSNPENSLIQKYWPGTNVSW